MSRPPYSAVVRALVVPMLCTSWCAAASVLTARVLSFTSCCPTSLSKNSPSLHFPHSLLSLKVKCLCENGADVNMKTTHGDLTALHLVVSVVDSTRHFCTNQSASLIDAYTYLVLHSAHSRSLHFSILTMAQSG